MTSLLKGAMSLTLTGGATSAKSAPHLATEHSAKDVATLTYVDRPSMHPVPKEVLSATNGPMPVRDVDHDKIVALRLDDGLIIVLYSNRAEDRFTRISLEARIKGLGEKVAQIYEAPSHYIREFYHHGQRTTQNQTEEVRGEMDNLIDEIVARALHYGASDILLHSGEGKDQASVKFIVHKRVQYHRSLAQERMEQLARALFAKAAAESKGVTFHARTGQDAKVQRRLKVGGQERHVSLRYASRPVREKFDLVLRVLNEDGQSRYDSLEQCGYALDQRKVLTRQNGRASGLVLMVGTTGSGKSTSMKVMIEEFGDLYHGQKHILTVEDPIEYVIRGARQTGVVRDEQIGADLGASKKVDPFQQALQWMLRAAPHAIFIGELRDRSTVVAAQKAVQTGHKVWSTLHAQSAFVAMDRLVDEGADRAVLFTPGFINAIVYQVLLPELCQDCRRPWIHTEAQDDKHAELHASILRASKLLGGNLDMVFVEGNDKACKRCKGTSVVGVQPCAEILVPDDEVLQLMSTGQRLAAEKYWRGRVNNRHPGVTGVTALEHGLRRMFNGEVSPFAVESEILPIEDLTDPTKDATEYARLVQQRAIDRTGGH